MSGRYRPVFLGLVLQFREAPGATIPITHSGEHRGGGTAGRREHGGEQEGRAVFPPQLPEAHSDHHQAYGEFEGCLGRFRGAQNYAEDVEHFPQGEQEDQRGALDSVRRRRPREREGPKTVRDVRVWGDPQVSHALDQESSGPSEANHHRADHSGQDNIALGDKENLREGSFQTLP